jgi:hypothetical protein
MLAYIFWHTPIAEALEYEGALAAFQAGLRDAAPEGFRQCTSYRVGAPWCDGYEDWYLVDDWAALGTLNEAAPLVAGHGPVAAMSDRGAGGVYRLVMGESALDATQAAWIAKPAGTPYDAWHAQLPERSVWRRQMVLGPAPEYCLPGEPGVQRSPLA